MAHDEPAAALAQRRVERAQAAEHERRPRAGREAAAQQRVVEDEDRHDAVVLARGERQGGVVGDAQVAAKPQQGGRGHVSEIRGYLERRLIEMPDRTVQDFPIFPLGLVALPYEYVPLHIFEPRYQTMFAECLERESEFGIVWSTDDGLREIGCACEITRVIERMEDGRLNVLTRGTRPFRIIAEQDDLPYPAATVEFLEDEDEVVDERAAEAARDAYAELVVQATENDADRENIDSKGAYAMAATVDFGLDAKQGLLDLRSENARMRLATRLFRAATKRLDFVERAQAKARSNGKVRFG